MRTIIAGSRDINDYTLIQTAVEQCGWIPTVIISGGARGVDRLGEKFAKNNNIPLKIYEADWDTYGKKAGYLRNQQMAEVADALIALWDGESRGTKHMIDIATKKELKVFVYKV